MQGSEEKTGCSLHLRMFQSSPGQKAGCKARELRPHDAERDFRVFQSSPGQKAGCKAWRSRAHDLTAS